MTTFPPVFDLTSLNGNNGFAINGIEIGDGVGHSVSEAGDVNGDGIADIIIGAPGEPNVPGVSYVLFGSKSGFTTPFNLTNLNGNNGFAINGINNFYNNLSPISGAGDVNGDGIADIIIGSVNADSYKGGSYVIFGNNSGFTTLINTNDLSGVNGSDVNESGFGL
jgi:hypothetical protein